MDILKGLKQVISGISRFEIETLKVFEQLINGQNNPYKSYVGVITQTIQNTVAVQPLTLGLKYLILTTDDNADFKNCGAENNEAGTQFVCEGDVEPNSWGDNLAAVLVKNFEPTVNILQNEIGEITWQYISAGEYHGILSEGFLPNKTICFISPTTNNENISTNIGIESLGEGALYYSKILIYSGDSGITVDNNQTNIEIRVYN